MTSSHVCGDAEHWLRWSDEKMPSSFKSAVRSAIETSERELAGKLEAAVHELEEQKGIIESVCVQAGCHGRACRGQALCARCSIIGEGTYEFMRAQCQAEQLDLLLQASYSSHV